MTIATIVIEIEQSCPLMPSAATGQFLTALRRYRTKGTHPGFLTN